MFASSFKRGAGVCALVATPFLAAGAVAVGGPRASARVQPTAPVLLPRDDLRSEFRGFVRRERARHERRLLRSGVVPVRGPVDFGTETNGFGAGRGGHVHNGQDMFAPSGTTLVAARDGIVLETGSDGGRGNYLVLYSPAARQTYAYFHMLAPSSLKPGRRVRAGRRVGALGCSGSCDGAHLHFEVHRGRERHRARDRPDAPPAALAPAGAALAGPLGSALERLGLGADVEEVVLAVEDLVLLPGAPELVPGVTTRHPQGAARGCPD